MKQTIVRYSIGDIKDRLAAAGFVPSLANVERVMVVVGPQPAVGGLAAQRDRVLDGLIQMAEGLEQRAKEVDDAE